MALRYSGRASMLNINGKTYVPIEVYRKSPSSYDGNFESVQISRPEAEHLMAQSNLHMFEDIKTGANVLDEATKPSAEKAGNK